MTTWLEARARRAAIMSIVSSRVSGLCRINREPLLGLCPVTSGDEFERGLARQPGIRLIARRPTRCSRSADKNRAGRVLMSTRLRCTVGGCARVDFIRRGERRSMSGNSGTRSGRPCRLGGHVVMQTSRGGRRRRWGAVALASVLVGVGCAHLHVRMAEAPNAENELARAATYRFLPVTPASGPSSSTNPILESSITLEQLQQDIEQRLQRRGYRVATGAADLSVAYYMGARQRLQVTNYGYGYPFWGWGWRWGPGWGAWPGQQVTTYEQGTIVVDILDGPGRRLLWRGMVHVRMPHDAQDYPGVIAKGVSAILKEFPGRPVPS